MTTWTTNVNTVTWQAVDDPSIVWEVNLGPVTVIGGGGATTLNQLVDVDVSDAIANDVLVFDGVEWVPGELGGDPLELGDLADVDLETPPTDGQALVYSEADEEWVPGDVGLGQVAEIATARLLGNDTGSDSVPIALSPLEVLSLLGLAPPESGSYTLTAVDGALSWVE